MSSYTQQNGIAKQKNRPLVDIVRTLLLNSNMQVRPWGHVVLTTCHLINMMYSFTLSNQAMYSILFSKKSLFHVTLRVLGCTYFVHDLTSGLDKFSARASKTSFLDTPNCSKDTNVYSPIRTPYYTFVDVTFFENTPFFSPSSTSLHMMCYHLPS